MIEDQIARIVAEQHDILREARENSARNVPEIWRYIAVSALSIIATLIPLMLIQQHNVLTRDDIPAILAQAKLDQVAVHEQMNKDIGANREEIEMEKGRLDEIKPDGK